MTDGEKLRELNRGTFAAEARQQIREEDWDKYLLRVLASDFQIRRSDPSKPPEDKAGIITHIQNDPNPAERGVSDEQTFQHGDYGVVTSIVKLPSMSDGFHNLKVFAKDASGDWKCVYWRVSKLPNR